MTAVRMIMQSFAENRITICNTYKALESLGWLCKKDSEILSGL
jgi:hypothetical protein